MRGVGGPLLSIGDLLADLGDETGDSPQNHPNPEVSSKSYSDDTISGPLDLTRLFQVTFWSKICLQFHWFNGFWSFRCHESLPLFIHYSQLCDYSKSSLCYAILYQCIDTSFVQFLCMILLWFWIKVDLKTVCFGFSLEECWIFFCLCSFLLSTCKPIDYRDYIERIVDLFQENYDKLNDAFAGSDHSWTSLTLEVTYLLLFFY